MVSLGKPRACICFVGKNDYKNQPMMLVCGEEVVRERRELAGKPFSIQHVVADSYENVH